MLFNEPHFTGHNMLNPPAIVQVAFDEQALKREWLDACADEQDAVSRKQAVLRKALARWPMVLSNNPGQRARGIMVHSLEMRQFVRDVLGMPDAKNGSLNPYAIVLLKEGHYERNAAKATAYGARSARIRRAVTELVTKYRLGADGHECMEALAKFYEEQTNVPQA